MLKLARPGGPRLRFKISASTFSIQNSEFNISNDFLPKRRRGEFGAENGGHVAIVEDRIDLDQIERTEQTRIRGDLHQHVGLSVVQPALDRRANARRDRGIADVQVERQMHSSSALA